MSKHTPADTKETKPTPLQEVKELIGVLVVAVLFAVAIKFALFDMFQIPSVSMEPTLHGRPDGGDRVFCTKLSYLWRSPARWEIVVFKYPDRPGDTFSGENFIKRLVALPGEQIAIRKGDVYTQVQDGRDRRWQRQVKDDATMRGTWIPVYAEDFADLGNNAGGHLNDFDAFWHRGGTADWRITPDRILHIDNARNASLTFRSRIRDPYAPDTMLSDLAGIVDRYPLRQFVRFRCPDGKPFKKTFTTTKFAARCPRTNAYLLEKDIEHYGRRHDIPLHYDEEVSFTQGEMTSDLRREKRRAKSHGFRIVRDLRISIRTKLDIDTTLALELREDRREFHARVSTANGRTVSIHSGSTSLATATLPAPGKNGWQTLEFYRCDGELRFCVDGQAPLLTTEIDAGERFPSNNERTQHSGVAITLLHGSAAMDQIQIDRDIQYYTDYNSELFAGGIAHVPEEQYLFLGDNCPSSHDGRTFGTVKENRVKGPALFVWWPPHRLRSLSGATTTP